MEMNEKLIPGKNIVLLSMLYMAQFLVSNYTAHPF
jgi:hypothetical protein